MESKPMQQAQPEFAVPIGLQYRLGIADALPSSHNISQFLASNASTFTPNNNTVRINVSSGAFLDLKNAVLEFDLKNTTTTDAVRLDGSAACIIKKITIKSSDGSTIERLDSYNLLDCILDQYANSDGTQRIKSAQKGAARYNDETAAIEEQSSGTAGTGEQSVSAYESGITIKGTSTTSADAAAKLQLKISGVGGIGYSPMQSDVLNTNITRHYSFGLKGAFFNPSTAKLLPPNTPFQLEIELDSAANALVNKAGSNAVNYQAENFELHVPSVMINDANYMSMVNQRLAQGVAYKGNSYDHFVRTTASGSGKDVVQIAARARSLKGLVSILRKQSRVSSDDDFKLCKRSLQYVSDYQYKLGSMNMPQDKVNISTDTTAGGTASGARLPAATTDNLNVSEAYNQALRLFGSLNISNAAMQIGVESFAQSENTNNNGAGLLAVNLSSFSDGSVNSGINTLNNMPVSIEFTKTAACNDILQIDTFSVKELIIMRDPNGVLSSMS